MKYGSLVMSIALVVGLVALFAPAAGAADAEYLGNTACKMCHNKDGKQWDIWSKMNHKKAFETLKTPAAIAIGKEKGLAAPPSEAPECLVCHVTSYDPKTKKIHAKIKMEDSVQCESCHGPAKDHQKYGMAMKMKKDVSSMDKGVKRPTVEDCVKCHNEKSPSWDPEKYETEDGKKVGFDFKKAYKKIEHPNPKE